ncbi:MAG: hypothetical protein AABX23_01860 [Nanoarchaeota archaeon]
MKREISEPHYSFDQILGICRGLDDPVNTTISSIRTHAANTGLAKEIQRTQTLTGSVRHLVKETDVFYIIRDLAGEREPEIEVTDIRSTASRLGYRK